MSAAPPKSTALESNPSSEPSQQSWSVGTLVPTPFLTKNWDLTYRQGPGPQPHPGSGQTGGKRLRFKAHSTVALRWVLLLHALVPLPTFCPVQHGDLSCFVSFTKLKGQGGTLAESKPSGDCLLGIWLALAQGQQGHPPPLGVCPRLCRN